MQALSDSQHARLSRLAGAYQQRHAEAFKAASKRNPHLWVDTLCFQLYGDALIGVQRRRRMARWPMVTGASSNCPVVAI